MFEMKTSNPTYERLKSEKVIAKLFAEGRTLSQFPLRLIYLPLEPGEGKIIKASVSVSKRNFKKAVDRNRIKRLLREVYRLNKSHFFNNTDRSYAFMILYLGNDIPEFNFLNSKLKSLFSKFSSNTAKEKI